MMGGYGGMMGGSTGRHQVAMMGGVPAPYTNVSNPLPRTSATIDHGAAVYSANCVSCHGATGLGDGAAASTLNPRPANLAWLSRMPMSRWDPFMYWTIAEGGAQFGTAMPAFKDGLSRADVWAVIAYVQAHLPQVKANR
jgi:mono/diheme cytochrome c family protein